MAEYFFVATIFLGSWLFWYILYGAECAINGGTLGRNPYTMQFVLAWEEFVWLFPGGWQKKLKQCHGDAELARTLPGLSHFIIYHVLIPFGLGFYAIYVLFWSK